MKKISQDYIDLKRYISNYISKFPLPTRAQNDENLKKLVSIPDKTTKEYVKLRTYIALSNGGFAMKYVQRYFNMLNSDSCISDLFQEAMIGITEAIDEFNTKLNTSFTTYAYFHIRKRIIDYIKKSKLIRAPRDIARNLKHVNDISSNLFSELQREPSANEISKSLKKEKGIDLENDVVESISSLLSLNSSSHDMAFIIEFNEQVASEEEETLIKRLESNICSSLKKTNDEDKKVIYLRFGIGKEHPHHLSEIELLINKKVPLFDINA